MSVKRTGQVMLRQALNQFQQQPTSPSEGKSSAGIRNAVNAPSPVLEVCPICNDIGWCRADNPALIGAGKGDVVNCNLIRCECKAAADARRWQDKLGLPLTTLTLDNMITRERPGTALMVAAARQFMDNFTGWLTIWGVNGTGKTMTLQAITNAALELKKAAIYTTAFAVVAYLKEGIGHPEFGVEDRLYLLEKIPFMCLDELAAIQWTPWVTCQLEELLNIRYFDDAPTILAMDMDPQSFLSQRLFSRINEMGKIIHNGDPDMRLTIQGTIASEGETDANIT